ncbi:unnamed protein product [Parascedosporium putredinis]|uniref:FAD-dependent oxidoreductase 2 FAD-binding domain-containing protein n=1 Tax=Parascedosporium putredinis TaxID=1442378 RepID=A0A9P1GZI6_9PEZI|nr:unnamed protein product [Parascedosporium putredinis]CAI7991848.1 unnamed protein product [Parascedosporium putredinis]
MSSKLNRAALALSRRGGPATVIHRFASSAKADHTVDLIVVGSGCAGLTAALVAAKQGLQVLVVEKSNFFGGTTAYSGGGAWIPTNKHQPAVGVVDDSRAKAETYLKSVLGADLYDPQLVDAFLSSGPRMVEWMEENTAVRFKPVLLPDYHEKKPGASAARTILTREFDASVLGRQRLRDLRYTLQGYHAFESMQADPSELGFLTHPFSTVGNFTATTRKFLRYVWDLVRYGKGSVTANGNALIARMIYSCTQNPQSITLWKNSPAVRTIFDADKGHVLGAVIKGKVRWASTAAEPGEWNLRTHLRAARPRRASATVPHFAIDRAKPGSIIVGPDGRRFENESLPYQEFIKKMHDMSMKRCFFIGDKTFVRRYGMGMALAGPLPIRHLVKRGYIIKANTIEELAAKIEVPPEVLRESVAAANERARTGVDNEYHRGETAYDQCYGDVTRGFKNPSLGPCETAPFYALPLHPGNVSTMHGVSVNENAQVLDEAGSRFRDCMPWDSIRIR